MVATGATEWDKLGDVKQAALVKATSLFGPTKMLGALADVKVSRVISGPSASHTIALTDAGVFVWGKNHMGQLGLGELGTMTIHYCSSAMTTLPPLPPLPPLRPAPPL